MTEQKANMRALTLEALLACRKEDIPSHLLIRNVLDKYSYLPERDRAFCKRLFAGTLENRLALDYVINQFSSLPVSKMKPVIQEILRLSVYQILYMDSVPDSAAVNEAVRLAARKGFGSLRGFVNGILRAVSRGREQIHWPEPEGSPEALSVRYSVPLWLTERWTGEYGREVTEKICASFQKPPHLTVRLRRPDPAGFPAGLKPAPYLPEAGYLEETGPLPDMPAFREGAFVVQDVSSMLAVRAAGIRPGDRILDICAAPGGKSLYAADLTGPGGMVTARDLTEKKCGLIREARQRCQLDNLQVEQADASVFRPEDEAAYDVVLADLPCSGYGVIGKKPDIRYRASREKEEELVRLQRDILRCAARYVKPGGVLLYSTCTFHREENEEQAEWLLHTLPGEMADGLRLEASSLVPYLPEELAGEETAERGFLQLLPGVHPCDGFFIARLIRR